MSSQTDGVTNRNLPSGEDPNRAGEDDQIPTPQMARGVTRGASSQGDGAVFVPRPALPGSNPLHPVPLNTHQARETENPNEDNPAA
ncbi:hypothetical protein FRC01_014023 [Tulasnella sp. 417]|nr:hypothetical protein FRC01_014023 [Tulasnella sp. 417]